MRETRDSAREVKFLLSNDLASDVLGWTRERLAGDPYAGGESSDEYRTSTLYFDTNRLAVYNRQGSYRRSKLRIRRYGASDLVFLERKLRTDRLLSKRRTTVPIAELSYLASGSRPDDWAGRWFQDRLEARRLRPIAQVSYRRHARVGMGLYGPMRITFDDRIVSQLRDRFEFSTAQGMPVIEGRVIVEMKFCVDMPAVFRHLVEEFRLEPVPLSKYRLALETVAGGRPDADALTASLLGNPMPTSGALDA